MHGNVARSQVSVVPHQYHMVSSEVDSAGSVARALKVVVDSILARQVVQNRGAGQQPMDVEEDVAEVAEKEEEVEVAEFSFILDGDEDEEIDLAFFSREEEDEAEEGDAGEAAVGSAAGIVPARAGASIAFMMLRAANVEPPVAIEKAPVTCTLPLVHQLPAVASSVEGAEPVAMRYLGESFFGRSFATDAVPILLQNHPQLSEFLEPLTQSGVSGPPRCSPL